MPGKIQGTVVSYSPAGNLVTDIPHERLNGAPSGLSVTIRCDEHETHGIFGLDHLEPEFSLLAVRGESGRLELTIVGDSAKIMLGVRLGEKVSVEWE